MADWDYVMKRKVEEGTWHAHHSGREPDYLLSIAISLKRIADLLEKAAKPPVMRRPDETPPP